MLEVDEARERILSLVRPLPAELVPVEEAVGRALAEDVAARRTLPPWDNSAMDGYAVIAADGAGRRQVIETIFAGQTPARTVGRGEAARIMTGAPMPKGADAVVMQEKTRSAAGAVEILEAPVKGASVRPAGEDAKAGELLLGRGTPLGIPEAGLLWAQGLSRASVPRRPRVALFSSGDELCGVEDEPRGRIVDTNTPSLALAVQRAGGVPTALGIAPDSLEAIVSTLGKAQGFDLVLTSAGVSVGERDFIRDALEKIGVAMSFWKVAIKPGKPLAAGKKGDTLFVGLPGNPTSSLVTFELFVRPALRRMLGHAEVAPPRTMGVVEVALDKSAGLTHFIRATASCREGKLWARPLGSQTSGALRSAARASCLLVFPKDATHLSPGDGVELVPLSWVA